MALVPDFMVSYRPELEVMLNSTDPVYKVLVYSGQLDVIIGAALTERCPPIRRLLYTSNSHSNARFLPFVNFPGKAALASAAKKVWRVQPTDTQVAGYARQVGSFSHVIVREAQR